MKSTGNFPIGLFIVGGLAAGPHLLHAQMTALPVQGGAGSPVDWSSASAPDSSDDFPIWNSIRQTKGN